MGLTLLGSLKHPKMTLYTPQTAPSALHPSLAIF